MGHKKLIRFKAIKQFSNVLEHDTSFKGKWNTFFKNENPLVLELACGKGEYTVGMASMYPQKNFLGIDVKGNRIWAGAKKALGLQLQNAAFLRTQIDGIGQYFEANEVSEIWITFPDPQLRWGKMNRRLTHPKFLRLYKQFLQPNGIVHLKTDSPDLYTFTKKVIELHELSLLRDITDVHHTEHAIDELNIKTHYEGLNISGSNTIFYLSFRIESNLLSKDEELKNFFKPKL
jgi:tRNA (guanine-N7-)-methyltransferase